VRDPKRKKTIEEASSSEILKNGVLVGSLEARTKPNDDIRLGRSRFGAICDRSGASLPCTDL
jgi:hypothetical protein